MKKEETTPKRNKKVLTLFIMMIPPLLLAMTSAIPSLPIRVGFQLVLFVFQYVLIKNLLDDYYGLE
ncbi:MAG: hypothetical protein ACHQ1D_01025 [Nitrososphaerales archaeon]